ncbi:hypothetical protein BGZ97_011283 [Linnemannia gamsii]|uniref:Uncharacterized protein n=1 Tax=Linnemannia gamsii TaxID=64522 RepID=A0A9P6UM12_9FUNG|nr:hypothetical protein BGZ97_011283 [Linnemannia gamsii]
MERQAKESVMNSGVRVWKAWCKDSCIEDKDSVTAEKLVVYIEDVVLPFDKKSHQAKRQSSFTTTPDHYQHQLQMPISSLESFIYPVLLLGIDQRRTLLEAAISYNNTSNNNYTGNNNSTDNNYTHNNNNSNCTSNASPVIGTTLDPHTTSSIKAEVPHTSVTAESTPSCNIVNEQDVPLPKDSTPKVSLQPSAGLHTAKTTTTTATLSAIFKEEPELKQMESIESSPHVSSYLRGLPPGHRFLQFPEWKIATAQATPPTILSQQPRPPPKSSFARPFFHSTIASAPSQHQDKNFMDYDSDTSSTLSSVSSRSSSYLFASRSPSQDPSDYQVEPMSPSLSPSYEPSSRASSSTPLPSRSGSESESESESNLQEERGDPSV